MGSLNQPPHLTLNIKPTFIPKTITQFLLQLSTIGTIHEKILKLDDFVTRLETEMHKIDAFKRELPLCMLLINDVIVALKDESMVFKKSLKSEPVLEEFIPIKKSGDEDVKVEMMMKEKGGGDKKNWLRSTQLWHVNDNDDDDDDDDPNSNQVQNLKLNSTDQAIKKRAVEQDDVTNNDSFQQFRNLDRAFIPISGLSLVTPGTNNSITGGILLTKTSPEGKLVLSSPIDQSNLGTSVVQGQLPQQQTSRKQRRCWSTGLHRRFVNALQQLGGSQAATPKQIRELMQVDGLTNDEVKSHLQKYRLHTRKLPSANTLSANQSGCILGGGLGMPTQDEHVDSSKRGICQSGSPDGPLIIGTVTGGTSTTGGDSMDDGEDSKSENYCWKGV